ncbi:MAG: chemotaxis response regulator protein-glutamate methylesterase [Phycisphaerales bacterium JB059]
MKPDVGVLIIDDSAIVRRALTEQLDRQPGIRVLGAAPDPYVGRDMIAQLKPDILTLDIEMPRMDGLTFLRKLMRYHPIPTVVVSSLTQKGCATAGACLEAGAIDVLAKPGAAYTVGNLATELARIIRNARHMDITKRAAPPAANLPPETTRLSLGAAHETTDKVVAIGASTGGTDALRRVLTPLPRTCPGIVMTQHMPAGFTSSFAARLNEASELEVIEARDGDSVIPGRAILAPGDKHLRLARDGARYRVQVSSGPRVCRHRPSVEVLFESVAEIAGRNALGVILTGMGDDGASGLRTMRDAGSVTIAQDEASCVVFGMPRAAIERDAACRVTHLDEIAGQVVQFAQGRLRIQKPPIAA